MGGEAETPVETIDTLVVGGGQAGIAMSEHLGRQGTPHLVVERGRIAERWRSERWDTLVANGPAWHDRFPGMVFSSCGADDFPTKDQVADYFVDYAKMIDAPVRCGVEVLSARRIEGRRGFRVETTSGPIEAANLVVATGPFQRPVIPPIVPEDAPVAQLHSNAYRNPEQLPEGAVLVVGAGSSGAQIAEELVRAGRRVYLSVGPHDRPPRRYRGRDNVWWLGVLGKWDAAALEPGLEHVTIAVSGARGGRTVDFRRFAAQGVTLVGLTRGYRDGVVSFAPDLAETIARGDANYLSVLDEADAYVARTGIDLPEDPEARVIDPAPACVSDPLLELDLEADGVGAVIWATGYALDFGWLKLDAFDESGKPKHQRGVSCEPGLYFVGLPWLSRRGSSFIWGVWHDAKHVADQIAVQRGYLAYDQAARESAREKAQESARERPAVAEGAPAPYVQRFREIAATPKGRETGLDGPFYTDPALYAAEAAAVLRSEWLYLCRADELPEPGDYLTLEALDEPLLVVRGDDGEIRVLSNVCRHRGSPVALGAGRAKRFVCPYHAWSYGRDGALTSAPRMEAERLDKARCGLPRHKAEVWMGFVYVNLDGAAGPLAPRLAPLERRLAPYETARMRHAHSAEELWRTNWKTLVENFMEAYHLSVVHVNTLHDVTPTGLSRKFEGGPAFSGYCANYPGSAPDRGDGAPGLSAEERRRSTLFSVFPCHVASQSASLLASYALLPEGPDQVRVRWSLSVREEDLNAAEIAERVALWTEVNREDREKLERTQRGFRSRFAQAGPLAPGDFEGVIADFHRYLARFFAPGATG